MDAQRHWKLVPCFDLTYSEGPGGEHQMVFCGKGLNITRSHLTKLAQRGGLDARWAAQKLYAMLEVVDQWHTLIESFDIRRATRQRMHEPVIRQREALMN
jgi:serine/threonine-protein kinase HipA